MTEKKYNIYFSEAVGAYRKAIDINPGNFDNYLNLRFSDLTPP